MPSLTKEDQKHYLGFQNYNCERCGKQPYKNYCRSCDEFFFLCDCPPEEGQSGKDHVFTDCRLYPQMTKEQLQSLEALLAEKVPGWKVGKGGILTTEPLTGTQAITCINEKLCKVMVVNFDNMELVGAQR